MAKPAPIETTDQLFDFAQRAHFPGTLMFTAEVGGLHPGQSAELMNERQLRRRAGGERVQAKCVNGPVTAERMAKMAKGHPFAIVRL